MQRVILFMLWLGFGLSACSPFEQLKKNGTVPEKQAKALEYYEKKEYVKAQQLFEDLASSVNFGTKDGELVLYYQAMTNYQLKDYILAAYQFRSFYRRYPLSEHAEECAYMSAYCHYLESPPYSLDQTDTRDAITEFTFFVKQFPKSPRVPECNKLVDKLYDKLELKDYEIAKQYYRIYDYKAAIASFENLLREFPDSKHREEVTYLMARCNYLLAMNSIQAKAEERAQKSVDSCKKFLAAYKDSQYESEVKGVQRDAERLLERLARDKKASQ